MKPYNPFATILKYKKEYIAMYSHRRFVHEVVKDAKYYLTAGNQSQINDKTEEAIAYYIKALELENNNIEALYHRGICYLIKDKFNYAISDFNKVLLLDPQHANAHMRLAQISLLRNKFDLAETHANAAIKFDPKCELAYQILASSSHYLGKSEQALAICNTMISQNPHNANSFIIRGIIYHGNGQFSLALSNFAMAYELDATAELNTSILFTCFKQGVDFFAISKQSIFDLIKLLPYITQRISLLKNCLQEGNRLGNRMWDIEFPNEGCNLKTGVLKDICDYLQDICPDFVLSNHTPSVTTNSMFKPMLRKIDDVDEYLNKQNCVMADHYCNF